MYRIQSESIHVKGAYSIRPYGRHWLIVAGGERIVLETRSKGRAMRIAGWLAGEVPADNSPVWDAVAAGLLADLAGKEGAA